MGKYINGVDRFQTQLFPPAIEDYVDENNEVRVIDAWVNSLDLTALKFTNSIPSDIGAPSFNPRDLLKVYVYCYPKNIRSSRRIEAELKRNIELIWLVNGLTPNHSTIADFRKNNVASIKEILKNFTSLCYTLNIFSKELSSQDGSKFKAVNSKDNNFTQDKLIDRLKRIEEKVDKYMAMLETNDNNDFSTEDRNDISNKIDEAKKKAEEYNNYLKTITDKGENQISLTDPESKLMKCNNNMLVGYNFQFATDTKSHIVMNIEGSNSPCDNGSIFSVASKVKETLHVDQIEQLVDGGYVDNKDIKQCFENKIIPILPDGQYELTWDYKDNEITDDIKKGDTSEDVKKCLESGVIPDCYSHLNLEISVEETEEKINSSRIIEESDNDSLLAKAKDGFFVRNKNENIVYCPCGHTLNYKRTKGDVDIFVGTSKCLNCPHKCTKENIKELELPSIYDISTCKKFNSHLPFVNKKNVVKKVVLKYIPDKEKYKLRKNTSEHPFGTLKRSHDASYFLLKGLDKVEAELTLSVLGYNFRRLINILGVEKLLDILKNSSIDNNLELNTIKYSA